MSWGAIRLFTRRSMGRKSYPPPLITAASYTPLWIRASPTAARENRAAPEAGPGRQRIVSSKIVRRLRKIFIVRLLLSIRGGAAAACVAKRENGQYPIPVLRDRKYFSFPGRTCTSRTRGTPDSRGGCGTTPQTGEYTQGPVSRQERHSSSHPPPEGNTVPRVYLPGVKKGNGG